MPARCSQLALIFEGLFACIFFLAGWIEDGRGDMCTVRLPLLSYFLAFFAALDNFPSVRKTRRP